jgi:hypothetical protein
VSDILAGVWAGARQVLGVVAPTIATALGGPLAGTAARFVTEALGLAPDATPADVTAALQTATPDQLLRLKAQEQDFVKAMRELDIREVQLANEDIANARAREVSLGGDWMQKALAFLAVAGGFLIGALVLTGEVRVNGEFAASIVMTLLTPLTLVFAYYFGSSAGSKIKTDTLARAVAGRG